MNNMHEILHSLLELSGQHGFPDASELHGLLCAHACVPASADHAAAARELLRWLGVEGEHDQLLQACDQALQVTTAQLLDPASDFQPLLPDDARDLPSRTEALAAWAGGFVSGMGVHGDAALHAEAQEALADLQQIARASVSADEQADACGGDGDGDGDGDDVGDAEALEQAYTELVEYTRVAVPLIHHALLLQAPSAPPVVLH